MIQYTDLPRLLRIVKTTSAITAVTLLLWQIPLLAQTPTAIVGWEIHSTQFETYMLDRFGTADLNERADDQDAIISLNMNPTGNDLVEGTVHMGITFIDLTSDGLINDRYITAVDELNVMFDVSTYGNGEWTGINFCIDSVIRPIDVLATPGVDFVLGPDGGLGYRDSIFADLAIIADLVDLKYTRGGTIPVLVFDGTPVFLGFSSMLPYGNPLDVVAIAGEVIDRQVDYRLEGETLGHLIANFIGLKSIWHNRTPFGDQIDDTPCGGGNFGCLDSTRVIVDNCSGTWYRLMHWNFMDGGCDESRYEWTEGQIERMRWLLSLDEYRSAWVRAECESQIISSNTEAGPRKDEAVVEPTVKVVPNPVRDEATIILTDPNPAQVGQPIMLLYDSSGKRIQLDVSRQTKSRFSLDVRNLPQGMYTLSVIFPAGESVSSPLVKR